MINRKFLSNNQKYVPGIFGGLGPLAHISFEKALIDECHKRGITKDQDFPVWILTSGSSTPDRTDSINKNHSALQHLIYFSKLIQKQGADFMVVTCNTAHYYQNEITKKIDIPLISIINETASYIARTHPMVEKVGIMATNGTVNSKLYQNALSVYGIKSVIPKNDEQGLVMDSIYHPSYGIKSTGTVVSRKAYKSLKAVAKKLELHGAEIIIAGCTEISAAMDNSTKTSSIINPLGILAESVINKCYQEIAYEAQSISDYVEPYTHTFLQNSNYE